MKIFFGIIFIIIGIYSIYDTYVKPVKGSMLLPNLSGFLGGIAFIAIGILMILNEFK